MSESLAKTTQDDPFARLNPAQRAAVEHGRGDPAPGPLLVIAGAGSGKTNTLAHRVARLLADGADPYRILLLTFSRRAAQDMTRRAERIAAKVLGPDHPSVRAGLPWAGTFHAVGARILREQADRIGLSPAFTIHDREDSADLMNLVRHERGLSAKETRFPAKGTCLAIYSRAVNAESALEPVLADSFPWCAAFVEELKTLFAAYVDAKQAQNVLDYDDLLLYWARVMDAPEVAGEIAGQFDHVLVDEYQDTNRLQAAILRGLRPDGRGVTVVGDDAQSIYSFRAATVRNILDFPGQFDPPARVVTLEENYRSTQPILAASNAVIGLAAERFTKNLRSERVSAQRPLLVTVRDEADQARYVAERVLEAREAGVRLKSQAVLFRASHHSAPLEVELARRNIPFVKFGGLRFLEAAHVKDVLAVLRFAGNPADRVTGFRVLQLLPGVGPATAGRMLDAVADAASLREGLAGLRPPAAAAQDWPGLVELLTGLDADGLGWPAEIERVRAWYEPHLERRYDDAAMRAGDLLQLEQIAGSYPGRERFLTELTLDPPDATSAEAGPPLLDEDYLILSTIHSAKGQEWTNVYCLNVIDGCMPSDLATGRREEIEEERRLLYVAMTRARDSLHLVTPQRFYVAQQARGGDRSVFASRTRFIPAGLLGLFETRGWPAASDPRAASRPAMATVDIGARVRGMWGA
ncbi:ATP-dependent helicase [Alsobacter sp. SYSU M60028]|uniref:DNA 3'-5' helicase n=1 Tax=Alsobacter ponti TaxID=2962936 RepID=A0ABT1L986_9HYPH|nr:ATP-dependent helicase [Alsobacter ponti]MCP8938052.1 ATP-dependent helicase [Alsobacter ponti]